MAESARARIMVDTTGDADYPTDLYRFDHRATYVDTLAEVGEDDLHRYREDGYLAVRHAFSRDEVEGALAALIQLIVDPSGVDKLDLQFEARAAGRIDAIPASERQDYVRKLMRFAGADRRLERMAWHEDVVRVVREMVSDDRVAMFQDMALLKPPGGGREKPWHQDKAFFNISVRSPVVGVWVALDSATPENGCMHVIPGTHLEGPVVHFKRRDWQICDDTVECGRDVMVPLEPGGCLFFDGLIHHGTPANRTPTRRRALQFHYTAASALWGTDEERLAIFGSEGKNVTC